MDVGRDVDAGLLGGSDVLDQDGSLVPILPAGCLDVAVVEVAAGPRSDLENLVGRLDDAVALRADVNEEGQASGGDDLAQGCHLIGRRVGGRHVDQPGRETPASLVQSPGQGLLHGGDVGRRGFAGDISHDEAPDRGVADEQGRAGGRA